MTQTRVSGTVQTVYLACLIVSVFMGDDAVVWGEVQCWKEEFVKDGRVELDQVENGERMMLFIRYVVEPFDYWGCIIPDV